MALFSLSLHQLSQTAPKRLRGRGESQFLTPFLFILALFGLSSLSVNLLHGRSLAHKSSFIHNLLNDSWTIQERHGRSLAHKTSFVHNLLNESWTIQESGKKRTILIRLHGYGNSTYDEGHNNYPSSGVRNEGLSEEQEDEKSDHRAKDRKYQLAGLNCDAYGGPSVDDAKEMVYWEDIPSDNLFVSPFKKRGVTKYLTFDQDRGGWNNVRMSMETIIALAFAMGRTLVLPPRLAIQHMNSTVEQYVYSFLDFFPLDHVSKEHLGLEIITMQEFLEREAMPGNLRDKNGRTVFPPGNVTNADEIDIKSLKRWLNRSMHSTIWDPDVCMAAFPASADPADIQSLLDVKLSVEKGGGFPSWEVFVGKPSAISASATERMRENWAGRMNLCMYNEELQNAHVVHFPFDEDLGARLLVPFYAFLFFQDWKHDLWMKRFMRDHVRYNDNVQCAAARVVHSIRQRARANGETTGEFDTFHIRRGDFGEWFPGTEVEASYIYELSKRDLRENATIYVATDEKNRSYFDPLREHYHLLFLDDFHEDLKGMNTNLYGMVDQLIASRGRKFFGCWFSTFTGYINRLRGYHANRAKAPGYEHGIIDSWFYAIEGRYDFARRFYPVKQPFHSREFAAGWRLIDEGIEELWADQKKMIDSTQNHFTQIVGPEKKTRRNVELLNQTL